MTVGKEMFVFQRDSYQEFHEWTGRLEPKNVSEKQETLHEWLMNSTCFGFVGEMK